MAFQGDSIYWVEVEKIVPNPYQPRREFDESKLSELAESVRMYGVLQPLTVTRKEVSREDGTFYTEYELIAGERRLRASKLAQLAQVPVIIRTGEQSDQEKLELAIIENLQREDLNAVDRAIAFRQLADQFSMSHAQVAKKVGRSREYVSNSLRLLNLPEYMLVSLKTGDISEGHGRTLLMLTDRPEEQDTVFREILLKKLSVREVERIARKIATDKVRKKDWGMDPVLIEIEKKFTDTLGTRVQIQKTDYGGKLMIDYFTNDDLEKLLQLIDQTELEARNEIQSMQDLMASTPLTAPVVIPQAPEPSPAPEPTPHAEQQEEQPESTHPAHESNTQAGHLIEDDRIETGESVTLNAEPSEPPPAPTTPSVQPMSIHSRPQPSFSRPTPNQHNQVQAQQSAHQPPVVQPTPEPAEKPTPEDSSDLYSIRNFNI